MKLKDSINKYDNWAVLSSNEVSEVSLHGLKLDT